MQTAILTGGPHDGVEVAVDSGTRRLVLKASGLPADAPIEERAGMIRPAESMPFLGVARVVYEASGGADEAGRVVFGYVGPL